MSITTYLLLTLLLLAIILASYYFWLYHHPLVQKLSRYSSSLLVIPLEQLHQVKWFLQRTGRLHSVLNDNDVTLTWLDQAIAFQNWPNASRCEWLAKRLGAHCQIHSTGEKEEVFNLHLGETFPLNLNSCLVYFPPTSWSVTEVIQRLQQDDMRLHEVLVISFDSVQRTALRSHGKNRTTPWIVPTRQELTMLLLHLQPVLVFAQLLANQLAITRISPYETKGGVTKETVFFGRERLLAQILNRDLKNYLVIGGRQLGKSSLLKQLQRHFQKNRPEVECYYLPLWEGGLTDRLKMILNLPIKTSFETLLDKLADVPKGRHRLFLIDEADQFVREEVERNYAILGHFRCLSEQGRCHFILAGFWYLYQEAVLNFQSPLKNFGESIFIGKLEEDACRLLATKPMALLGLRYASPELVEDILEKTGQRANLVATVCDEMLKGLDHHQRELTAQAFTQALNSQEVQESLMGFSQLTDDEEASRLDRVIIYATVEKGQFKLAALIQFLDKYHYAYTPEQLKQSLTRLELAFIVRRQQNIYHYCVPLFRQMLMDWGKQELVALLKQELKVRP